MRIHQIVIPLLDWDTLQEIRQDNIYKFSVWLKHGFSLLLALHELNPNNFELEPIKDEKSILHRIDIDNEVIDITDVILLKVLGNSRENIPDKVYMSHYGLEIIWENKTSYNKELIHKALGQFFSKYMPKTNPSFPIIVMETTIGIDKQYSEIKCSSTNAFNFPPVNNELWTLFKFPAQILTSEENLEDILTELSLAYLISLTYALIQTYKVVSVILRLHIGRQYVIFNELERSYNLAKRNLIGINKELFDFISLISENIKLATLSVEEEYQNLFYEIYSETSTNFYIPRIMLNKLYEHVLNDNDRDSRLLETFREISPKDIEHMKDAISKYEQLYHSSVKAYFNSFVDMGTLWYNAYQNRLSSIRATLALILSLASIFLSIVLG